VGACPEREPEVRSRRIGDGAGNAAARGPVGVVRADERGCAALPALVVHHTSTPRLVNLLNHSAGAAGDGGMIPFARTLDIYPASRHNDFDYLICRIKGRKVRWVKSRQQQSRQTCRFAC